MSEPHAGEEPVTAQDCAARHTRRKPINIAPQIDCGGARWSAKPIANLRASEIAGSQIALRAHCIPGRQYAERARLRPPLTLRGIGRADPEHRRHEFASSVEPFASNVRRAQPARRLSGVGIPGRGPCCGASAPNRGQPPDPHRRRRQRSSSGRRFGFTRNFEFVLPPHLAGPPGYRAARDVIVRAFLGNT